MALVDKLDRQLTFAVLFLVDEAHVEALRHHGEQHLEDELGEGLSKADALASVER